MKHSTVDLVLDAEVQPADESLDDVSFLAGDISAGEVFSTTPRFGSARSQIRIPSALLMERAQADGKSRIFCKAWYKILIKWLLTEMPSFLK